MWGLFVGIAFALECDRNLLPYDDLAKIKSRSFVYRAPYLARRLGVDEEDIEQILRIKAWQAMGSYNPDKGPEKTFINSVMNNRIRDLVRRSQAIPKAQSIDDDERPMEIAAREEGDPMEWDIDMVKQKLGVLSRSDRRYMLMALDGMSVEQICEATGTGITRVKKSLQTSKRTLRDIFSSPKEP